LHDIDQETELMHRVGQGDATAFRILSEKHARSIVNYAYRMLADRNEAEDVAQETFLRLWTGAARWEPRAGVSAWLHRVAHNLCIDVLRRRRPRASGPVERFPDGDRPSGLVARRRLARTVEEAVEALPERQRAAVTLVHYQGLTNIKAAAVLEVSVDALESLLARGRGELRSRLSGLKDQMEEESDEG
jgi:RNA polymerase sigma-70 factor (ECF subfamily)